jgi:hypothetical protein
VLLGSLCLLLPTDSRQRDAAYVAAVHQRILNSTRTLFGRHRMGHIFPMLLNVTRLDTEFAGIMQRIQTQDEYILFLTQSFIVTAATQRSLSLLGVSGGPVMCVCTVAAVRRQCRLASESHWQVDVLEVDDNAVDLSKYIDANTLRALVEEQQKSKSGAAARRAQRRRPVRRCSPAILESSLPLAIHWSCGAAPATALSRCHRASAAASTLSAPPVSRSAVVVSEQITLTVASARGLGAHDAAASRSLVEVVGRVQLTQVRVFRVMHDCTPDVVVLLWSPLLLLR